MAISEIDLGQLVRSNAGRDKDRLFLLIGILDPVYVLISDGVYRKVERPKKKKRKHLQFIGLVDKEIGEMLEKGKKPSNEKVAQAINVLNEQL